MSYDDVARRLADPNAIGLTEELARKLKVRDADVTRAQLLAEAEDHGHVGVYLLAAYVEDDTDTFGKGEIYWWSIPVLGNADGSVTWKATVGLPSGAPPVKCDDREWLASLSLDAPPLLALIPPGDDYAACLVKLGVWDDDGAVADLPKAMTAGLAALSELPLDYPLGKAEKIVDPVRAAIYESLRAKQDDVLLEQELRLLRNDVSHYGAGLVHSAVSALVRVYLIAKDELKTHAAPAVTLVKDQSHTFRFATPIEAGGRLAVFARGPVEAGRLGTLSLDLPFLNHIVVDDAASFADGLTVTARGSADVVAFYTAP